MGAEYDDGGIEASDRRFAKTFGDLADKAQAEGRTKDEARLRNMIDRESNRIAEGVYRVSTPQPNYNLTTPLLIAG